MISIFIKQIVYTFFRRQMAKGHLDDLMLELVSAAKEVWHEDNVFTINAHLKKHLNNALHYEYQYLGDLP